MVLRARLTALLRNPLDRAYSDYQQVIRKGREDRTFEETIEEAIEAAKTQPLRIEFLTPHENRTYPNGTRLGYLFRGIYVEYLLHWSRFFPKE